MIENKLVKPISVCWLLTSKCNYACPFCFKQGNKRELYYNEAEKILEKIVKAGAKKVSFSGGEPLLWPGTINLIKKAKSLGLMSMLITNGSLLNRKKIKSLENILDWLTLPLDGSNEIIQQMVGRKKGHFNRVLKFLHFLKNNHIKVKINTVVCKKNQEDIKNIAQIIKKYNVKRWKLFQFYPIRDAALQNRKDYIIKNKDFNKLQKEIEPLFKNSPCYLYFGLNKLLESSYFTIAPDGTAYVSKDGSDYFIGDLKIQEISEIWQNKLINKKKYWQRVSWILRNGFKKEYNKL